MEVFSFGAAGSRPALALPLFARHLCYVHVCCCWVVGRGTWLAWVTCHLSLSSFILITPDHTLNTGNVLFTALLQRCDGRLAESCTPQPGSPAPTPLRPSALAPGFPLHPHTARTQHTLLQSSARPLNALQIRVRRLVWHHNGFPQANCDLPHTHAQWGSPCSRQAPLQ